MPTAAHYSKICSVSSSPGIKPPVPPFRNNTSVSLTTENEKGAGLRSSEGSDWPSWQEVGSESVASVLSGGGGVSGQRPYWALGPWTGSCLKSQECERGVQNGPPSSRWVRSPGSPFAEVPHPDGWAAVGQGSTRTARTAQWPRDWKEGVPRALAAAFPTRPWPVSQRRFSFSPVLQACFWHHGAKGLPESLCRL